MTKYILHGGETKVPNEHNKEFYQSWVKDFEPDFVPTILLVYFASTEDKWAIKEQQDKERFANYTDNRNVNFVIASTDTTTFKDQIKTADVIYVRGGSSEAVIELFTLLKEDFKNLFDGKIYVGSSAGVMVISNYTCSAGGYWKKGLGILPINTFVHWNPELQDQLDAFKKEHPDNDFEWLLIPETEFVIKSY
ncbi:MAG TPA: Type 1 glutamine amidotransferase-like domain-containing protein [Patescibacteria group bacterium]|jgi:peptidase E|nr:Type 1 glutamine amidotransferase-like domain-containing protein [Patescibacteria group bacterium]